jgi:hypothetical protein
MIKQIEDIIRVRDELREMQKKIEHLCRELDGSAAEMIGFLKEAGYLNKS